MIIERSVTAVTTIENDIAPGVTAIQTTTETGHSIESRDWFGTAKDFEVSRTVEREVVIDFDKAFAFAQDV